MGSSLGAQPLPPSCEGAGTQTIDGSNCCNVEVAKADLYSFYF